MADTKQKWQEIASRGLQDRFDPQTRVKFDEAVKRGLITIPQQESQNVDISRDSNSVTLPSNGLNAQPVNQDFIPTEDNLANPLPAQPENPTITDEVIGGLDTAKTIVSSAIAEPVSGLVGGIEAAGRATLNALGFDAGDPTGEGVKTINAVKDFMSLEPSTPEGTRNLKVVGDLVKSGVDLANIPASGLIGIGELLSNQGIEQASKSVTDVQTKGLSSVLGQRTLDATGSPELAAIAHSLPTAALEAMGVKGLKGSKLANEKLSTNISKAIQQAAPDIKTIQKAKSNAYAALDDFGVRVKAETFDLFADKINARLIKEGVDPTLTPKSTAALKRIVEAKGEAKTLSELDTLRKIAKGAANDIDKTDARLGNIIITELDNGIDKLSSQIGGQFKEARGLAQRAFKSQDISDMMENASHTASGLENGLRIEARKILKNKKRRKGFSTEELVALRKIEQGTTLGNLSKFLGKFGISEGQATSMLGASFGAGGGGVIGTMFGGPIGGVIGAIGVPAMGQIAKNTSQRITLKNTKFADDLIRAGKNSKEVTKAYLKNTPISERSVSDLTDLLMNPNLTGGDVKSLIKANSPTSKFLSDTLFFVNESKRRLKQGASTAAITQPDIDKENK
jgi:hypothetical protein